MSTLLKVFLASFVCTCQCSLCSLFLVDLHMKNYLDVFIPWVTKTYFAGCGGGESSLIIDF